MNNIEATFHSKIHHIEKKIQYILCSDENQKDPPCFSTNTFYLSHLTRPLYL